MLFQEKIVAQLSRQANLLPDEIGEWGTMAEENVNGMGIHRSQLRAINLTFDELQGKQEGLLSNLQTSRTPDDFAKNRRSLEAELSGAQGIISIFRYIFTQRRDTPRYLEPLDAADLIAANSYSYCLELAKSWQAIDADKLRVPPLTYLNAKYAPFALTRRSTFAKFKLPLDNYLELKLPISVIGLPFHYTTSVWSFCSLSHEVGHLLDQDLGLRDALRDDFKNALVEARVTEEHQTLWGYWLGELVADIFGMLLMGAAFAYTMLDILSLPKNAVAEIDATDIEHPNPYVRVFFIGSILRETNLPQMTAVADELETGWKELYGPPEEMNAEFPAYIAESRLAANFLLNRALLSLNGHRLLDFGPTLARDDEQIRGLARYLRRNYMRPDPGPPAFPYRFVPAAAQLAAQEVKENHAQNYDAIQQRALGFIKVIDRPEFLAPTPAMSEAREQYLRQLVRDLDFEKDG
jgi:hypothetical protein